MSRTDNLFRRAVLPVGLSLVLSLLAVTAIAVASGPRSGTEPTRSEGVRLVVQPGHSAVAKWSRGYRNGGSGFRVVLPDRLDAPFSVGLVLRGGRQARTGYRAAVAVQPDGAAVATISRVVRTKAKPLARVALAPTWRPGDVLSVDALVRGSNTVSIRMRAWADSASPPAWQAKAVDRARSRVSHGGQVYAWARLSRSADSPLTLALRPLETATTSPTPTGEPTTEPVPSDEFGPLGRAITYDDLTALGWDGVQKPSADSVTLVEDGVALGPARPPGALLRAKLEPGETYTDGRCRAEVYGRRPLPWSTPAPLWPDPVGSERWYSFSVFVPETFPVASDTTWLDFTQWKGYVGGTPPLALEIKRSNFRFGGARTNSGLIPNDGHLGSIAFGQWTRFTVGIRFSTSADDGWVEVYKNGAVKLPRTSVATMDTYDGGPDPIYLKQGIYRSSKWTVRQALYFSPMTITETMPASP